MKLNIREPGLPASVALHVAVLLAGIINFSSPKPFADAQEAISVEVIDESAIREVTKGERQAKPQPVPAPRVDRVDNAKEQNSPGEAKRQVNADATPKPQEATAREDRKETTAAVTPPPPPPSAPRIVPAAPPKPEPPKPAEPPKPVAAKPPKPADSTDEEEEEAEEVIRQAARKKAEEQKKLEDQRRAEERRKAEDAKRQEVAKQEVARQEAARQEQALARAQAEARQREDQKKLADAKAAQDQKAAEDRKNAEDARKAEDVKKAQEAKQAQEAARKAAEDRRKREAEQEARNQATADAARRALLASREAPSNSGNTGQQVSRTPSQGTPTATGQRLNPSERGALVGMIADQIRACWNVPVAGKPSVMPQVRVALNQDGSLAAQPTLINASGDPLFRAVADSGMRAIRQCSPFRIPARFAPMYGDWRSLVVQLNPDD